jgi:Fe-S-cluster containining protein
MTPNKSADKKWYAAGLHFECQQCGNCCSGVPGYVWVNDEEALAIAAFLKMPIEAFAKKYLRKVGKKVSLIELPNYDCVFLTRSEKGIGCSIYPVRPEQCRTWPFWHYNLESPDDYIENTKRCPGINRGRLFTLQEIEEKLKNSPC